ncbi:MAG: hypothetical protein DME26_06625 [Verrucomicrobia bacterium]|nr:MAG: hypothetical protein DME26_06625 [Verrucomicrobiota bacterium]
MTPVEKPNPALNRIAVIERSLRCFGYGLIGLIPVLGFPLAVLTVVHFQKARLAAAAEWNPASAYLNWGLVLAALGCGATIVLFGLFLVALIV